MALALQQPPANSTRHAARGSAMTNPALAPERPLDADDLLLARIANNDEVAFRALVERHVDRAYALALRILRNAADAEDVAQDVMLKVWTHRGNWQAGRARFSTWLYRVVTNRCLDLHRRPRTEDIEQVPESADGRSDAVDDIHRTEVTSLLDRAMGRLPEQQRIALILSYTDDLRNAEIAEIMETTVMAVESLLKRGRQQLRHFLANAEGDIRDSFTRD
ncbi:RNA polymerase sigma-70 factor, ECF subfamily [Devosia sp. YR412]|uniref:RNA polymerase sigma factor n=1 Tax=Devosia sp. YR412 TaxID=1881030 RepID=UPI0008AF577F|nr:RNA polymerase sigma factor [Devosia sp. YR412]SEQ52439.1 RNA polymerase sigma-70 factor, ECF subfamily [Devosia sp. YR412]